MSNIDLEGEYASKALHILNISGLEAGCSYDLDEADLSALRDVVGIHVPAKCKRATLREKLWFDELPYQVHTGRELSLMLEGKKPLSSFTEEYPLHGVSFIPESIFERYVTSGQFIKAEYISEHKSLEGDIYATHWVFYALRGEEWRINAYILLLKLADTSGWSDDFERIEGALLGYEIWQNEAYIKQKKHHSQ
ncbi:MAG: hypothetical protein B7X28_05350 [Halothiobacillus sp. 13-55-253]|jgi:mRNA-degrading endonuclease HigB of HigAB toxin-antitoxin module|nr:MAG: hypothetical protein B7X28_05350 [Halothiobacillus sp. 13-55-253]